jgi:Immunoglobulin-like domain of bacterial spore germination/Sporulation and spore germination
MSDDERARRDEELLRRALHQEADQVLPSLDALSSIRRRTARTPLWQRPVVWGMAAASITALAVIVGSAYFLQSSSDDTVASGANSSPSPVESPTVEQSPTASPAESPTSPTGTATSPPETEEPEPGRDVVPVYYITETTQGDRLAREFRDVPAPEGPLVAAVATMLAEPARDPDYQSYWLSDTQVRRIEIAENAIEVDFTGETDYTSVPDDIAQLAVQQLVYTVTAAASDAGLNGGLPVQILVDDQPPAEMWGQLDLSEPIARAPQANVRQLVQIDEPLDGAVLGRTATFRGVALAYEAQVYWQVFDDEGHVVEEGFTLTTDSSTFAPFTFEVELEPGFYSVVVTESDPTGGAEGPGPMSDTKNFSVE